MKKYRVTIEFETDKPLRFAHDAQLLHHMQVQLESLTDGTIGGGQRIVNPLPAKIEEVVDQIPCPTCGSTHY